MPLAYANVGEIRSVYDARAIDNPSTAIVNSFDAQATTESDFAKMPTSSATPYQAEMGSPMYEFAENRLWRSFGIECESPNSSMRSQ